MNKIVKLVIGAATAVAAATVLLGAGPAAQGDSKATGDRGHGKYAHVNGLRMYYEVHGHDRGKPPLVLLHGAFSATGTSWGELIRPLSRDRKVISIEQQGHGRTADVVDRPIRTAQMAADTVALLRTIGVRKADFYGYSMGSVVAMHVAVNHPEAVNKVILQSGSLNLDGMHPGHAEGMAALEPWMLKETEFYAEYRKLNPRPQNFDLLVTKVKDMVFTEPSVTEEALAGVKAPVLTIIGDSDIVRPEHAVEMFRLTGGGVNGDIVGGPPNSQLAVLPGTTHITSVYQKELLGSLVPAFLNAPVK